ncbi:MAG TPA: serine hydrolase [Gemmatimonadaceae bacterium]|nr:serine hydrolase [Gemmatimonadaceae bacterium]
MIVHRMHVALFCSVAAIGTCVAIGDIHAQAASQGVTYFPAPDGRWERRSPRQVGMDSVRLAAGVGFAIASEARAPRDLLLAHVQSFGREPFGDAVGPFKPRGDPTGLIIRRGYVVAEWGDPRRVDMTFSVTKSFLSTVVGVAFDRGLIPDLDRPVHVDMAPVVVRSHSPRSPADVTGRDPAIIHPFDTPHNRRITWNHLLRQTSDWEGTLWGKPDWADRPDRDAASWLTRARKEPGSSYEYNDVRVNALALAALNIWRRPLPGVLAEYVMDPIGASRTWRWYGYDNSWIVLDGAPVQSVSGGGHWGGGMFISAYDQARFGLLTLRRGVWGGRRILSERWVRMALTPTPAQTDYGFMNWFLNTGRKRLPSAPESAFMHLGNGTNMIYVDAEHDLVIVARWIDNGSLDGLVSRVLAAID